MNLSLYRYSFGSELTMQDVKETLTVAVLATQCLHGLSQVMLDTRFSVDSKKRRCVVDAGSAVGRDIARIFTGLLSHQYGETAFKVKRIAGGRRRLHRHN